MGVDKQEIVPKHVQGYFMFTFMRGVNHILVATFISMRELLVDQGDIVQGLMDVSNKMDQEPKHGALAEQLHFLVSLELIMPEEIIDFVQCSDYVLLVSYQFFIIFIFCFLTSIECHQ